MRMDREGHVYPPYRVKPDRALAEKFLRGQGVDAAPEHVPPTYMIFLRGETRGVDLFTDLDVPREKALHGGQRYTWFAPIDWDDELEVTATVEKVVEKQGRSGKVWFADIAYDYVFADTGKPVMREITQIVERS
jgi:N-terminal half of MaoC dehydratase